VASDSAWLDRSNRPSVAILQRTLIAVVPSSVTIGRYDSLDFWRGVACLAVVLYHSVLVHLSSPVEPTAFVSSLLSWFGQLSIGVHMFFVISGYCIAAAADRSRAAGRVSTYFLRRFRRIYPPLWAAMGLAGAIFVVVDVWIMPRALSTEPWIQPRPWWYSSSQWFGNITLTETWRHHVFGDPRAHFPGQAWTLCYEEQFYAVMGLLLFVPRFLFAGAAAVSAMTAILLFVAPAAGWDLSGFFFDGSWLNFAAGILVYRTLRYAGRLGGGIAVTLLMAGVAAAPAWNVPGGSIGFAFALILLGLHRFDRRLAGSRFLRPISYCGEMCYSLYLVHQLLVKATAILLLRLGVESPVATLFLTVPLCVLVSVVVARGFYVLIERRFVNVRAVTIEVPKSGLVRPVA
jgi:peptidoglycan/LPS O-acetylase OafA/YrhL